MAPPGPALCVGEPGPVESRCRNAALPRQGPVERRCVARVEVDIHEIVDANRAVRELSEESGCLTADRERGRGLIAKKRRDVGPDDSEAPGAELGERRVLRHSTRRPEKYDSPPLTSRCDSVDQCLRVAGGIDHDIGTDVVERGSFADRAEVGGTSRPRHRLAAP